MKKKFKLLLLYFILFTLTKGYSQNFEINLSPEGKLETIYDNQGNEFKLKDILINNPRNSGILATRALSCSTSSYFNLYFESGCGMEDTSNPSHNARRAVMCKVFEDVSNFISSPLSITGNKVNIWVRNIANMNIPSGTLGSGSSFYLPSPNVGGILDGEIWKTIHLGVDSYTNVLNGTNLFYHGTVSFNFNDPNINWNTNLSINTPSSLYDLYTVILHEVLHSLGIGSFINQNGNSIDPFPYYSRYDTFLRTNNNVPLLSVGNCSMYDVSFNSGVSPTVLRPGCTLQNNLSTGVLNNTNCSEAIKYEGSSIIPVYTPTCFEQGSSLSHFEDLLYPNCTLSYGNDSYFVLSNVNLLGTTKRYLKPEERNVLCDIGYNVQTTYGESSTIGGFFNYGGTICAGITVAGLNDGINSNGDYTFVGNANNNITINGATILNNDANATGFECLQDISAPSTLSETSGNSSTAVNFTSATTGLHVLRYVPVNGTQRGNITYIYVYIRVPASSGGCSPKPSSCNLVMNGNFEEFSSQITGVNIRKACGWDSVSQIQNSSANANYFSSTAYPTLQNWRVPCNWLGNQSNNNNNGNGYAGIYVSTGLGGKQHLYTTLNTPLQANTNYQLSFDVSLADGYSHWASNLQAFLHRSNTTPPSILAYNSNGDVSIVNNALDTTTVLISPTVTRNTNGWDTITFNFTTTIGGEQFLYLGLLNNAILVSNTPAGTGIGECNYQSGSTDAFGNKLITYYVDNVSLIPTNGAVLNLPTSICNTQNLSNLLLYISGTTADGAFSGTGVSFANGVYSFNPSIAGVGTTTIGYTYTNKSGCTITLYDTINISTTSSNNIVVDAINDDFSSMPISSTTGGITTSVYSNDLYNGLPTSSANINNVTFNLVSPISIAGATINSQGVLSIPSGVAIGTYTLNYMLSAIGNCTTSDIAAITIVVTDGSITPTIVAGLRANNTVSLIGLQSSNKSIISGFFSRYNNILQNRIARLNTNLTLDTTFNSSGPSPSSYPPQSMAIQSDDKIIVVGSFTGFSGGSNGFGIARLNVNGSIDTSFNAGGTGISLLNYVAYTCAIQQDGKILVGGQFGSYNGVNCSSLIRLNSNGSIDPTFTFQNYSYSWVNRVLIQPDGKILVEGYFGYSFTDPTNRHLIRLNSDGTLDSTFTTGYTGPTGPIPSVSYSNVITLQNMALQSDGKIIIVGAFTNYNGTSTNNIIRLFSNGQIDSTFNTSTGVDRGINEALIEPTTNKIIIGGEFTTFGTTAVNKLIRLTTNGSLDTSFSIGSGTTDTFPPRGTICFYCYNYVKALKQQPDGKIIVGGKFTTFNGLSATSITRIFGDAGVQAKSSSIEYQSEPEIDTNPNYSTITIYPNPSKGIYTIDLSYEKDPTNIEVYNVLGELVFSQMLIPQTQNQIDLTHVSNGYYIAHISNGFRSMQQKLIKN
jgi:uncharacterized delta-60 repeat protein